MIVLDLLKTLPFFSSLSEEDNIKIIENVKLHYFPPDHVIFKEGEGANEMYVIRFGRVKIYREENGTEKKIAELGPSDFFGEIALISEKPRNASVKTLEECEAFSIKRDDLKDLIEKKPEIAEKIKEGFIARVRQNAEK